MQIKSEEKEKKRHFQVCLSFCAHRRCLFIVFGMPSGFQTAAKVNKLAQAAHAIHARLHSGQARPRDLV